MCQRFTSIPQNVDLPLAETQHEPHKPVNKKKGFASVLSFTRIRCASAANSRCTKGKLGQEKQGGQIKSKQPSGLGMHYFKVAQGSPSRHTDL